MAVQDRGEMSSPYSVASADVVRAPGGRVESDRLAVEEPLEIRIGGRPVAVTMRTPGHDEELALGFCISEGLEPEAASLTEDLAANTVDGRAPALDPARPHRRCYPRPPRGVRREGARP